MQDTPAAPAPQPTPQPVKMQRVPASKLAIDTLLEKAELHWASGDLQKSLRHYDDALRLAREKNDGMIEGMVLAGKGCALASTGEQPSLIEALDCYTRSKKLAEAQGMATQVEFMESLIVGVTKALYEIGQLADCTTVDALQSDTSGSEISSNISDSGSDGSIDSSSDGSSDNVIKDEALAVADATGVPTELVQEQQPPCASAKNASIAVKSDAGTKGDASPTHMLDAVCLRQPAAKELVSNATIVALPSCGSAREQRLWQLELLHKSRVLDEKVARVVMWQLSAHNVLQLILGRPAPPPKDFDSVVISYTREQALKLSRKVADLLGLAPADVSTRVVKATKSAHEIAATIYVRTESLVANIHATFDKGSTGHLTYSETREFLATIRSLDPEDYKCFCCSVGADPVEGIDRETLLNFYLTCEPSSLVEEFKLLTAHFSSQATVDAASATAASADAGDESATTALSHEEMVKKIFEEFDADGDGLLSFDEFSSVLSSMCALTQEQFVVICESLEAQPAAGLSVTALTYWYENEASLDQLHLDYGRVVLGLESAASTPSGNQKASTSAVMKGEQDSPKHGDCPSSCVPCSQGNSSSLSCSCPILRRVNVMMESGQYTDCVKLLSELMLPSTPVETTTAGNKPNMQSPDASASEVSSATLAAADQSEEMCRQSFLRIARGNAYFKLSEYTLALSDYESAVSGSVCEVSGELQRRIRICKLKQRSKVEKVTQDDHLASSLDSAEEDAQLCGSLFEDLVAEFKAEGGLDPRRQNHACFGLASAAASTSMASPAEDDQHANTTPAKKKRKKKKRQNHRR
jgi:hypothetical protein